MKRLFILASGLWLLASPPAHALIDTNTNGLSDLWEKAFNSDALFSAENPDHDPTADPDGDGWMNHQEATAGTHPFDAQNGQGMLTPSVAHTPAIREPAPPGADIEQLSEPIPNDDPSDATTSYTLEIRRPARFTLTWPTIAGKAYRIDHSTNLTAWTPASRFFMGQGNHLTYKAEALHTDNTEPEEIFYRVVIEDADTDGDNLTDWEEGSLGTDPFSTDTDRDGIPDDVEIANGSNPLFNHLPLDPDGAGMPADALASLVAWWDMQPPPGSYGPLTLPSRSADLSGVFHSLSQPSGSVSTLSISGKAIRTPTNFPDRIDLLALGQNSSLRSRNSLTLHYWLRLPKDHLTPASGKNTPLEITLAAYNSVGTEVPNFEWSARRAPNGGTRFLLDQGNRTNSTNWFLPGAHDTPLALDDERWHHLALVIAGNNTRMWLDGAQIGPNSGNLTGFSIPSNVYTTAGYLRIGGGPRFIQPGIGTPYLASDLIGEVDGIMLHHARLDSPDPLIFQKIYRRDRDNDGLWDVTEAATALWRDTNANTQRDPGEITYTSSPDVWNPPGHDTDGDDLSDADEQTRGTNIANPDTDGDLLPDGWEVANNLDPLISTGVNGGGQGPDTDDATNLDEYRHTTNPRINDTDGDGKTDAQEINGPDGNPNTDDGSNPNDASDGGQQLPPAQRVTILLGVGDESGSESEDYVMHIYRIDPATGAEIRFHTHRSGGYGQYNEKPLSFFRKGEIYTFQIDWQGSNNNSKSVSGTTPAEGPDFDYTFKVQPQGVDTGFLIDGYDPRRAIADLTKPLLAAAASDVAVLAVEFREKFANRRVVLMGVSTLSADRMFGASMQVLPGLENIQLEITNTVTGEVFGTHSQLFEKAYDNYEAILGYGDNFGRNVSDPRVWFIKTLIGPYGGIQAYLCGDPAKPHGTVRIKGALKGFNLGSVKHDLSPDDDMAAFIGRAETLAKGTGLGFPVAPGQGANATAAPGKAHYWAAALAVPGLMVGNVIENETALYIGIYDGVVAGLTDDWKMWLLVVGGLIDGGDWVEEKAGAYLTAWRTDPVTRLREVKDAITRFVKNQVCDKMGAHVSKLGTVQGFFDTVWGLTPVGMFANAPARFEALVGRDPWELLSEAVGEWFDDFGTRMLNGAEKADWVAEPFPQNAFIVGSNQRVREMRYVGGYTFGYLAEQVTVGVVGGKAITLTASMTIRGVKLATATTTALATRTVAAIAAKGAIIKKAAADATLSVTMRVALEEGFVLAARTPTPGVAGGKNILSVIEESYRALPGPAPAATINMLVDDIVANPRLASLALGDNGALEILSAAARLQYRLGADATKKAISNIPKLLNTAAPNGQSGLANDLLRYSDFEQALKLDTPQGRVVAKDFLESIDGKTAQVVLDKAWLPPSAANLYPKLYRYAANLPPEVNGVRKLTAHNGAGWYCTPEKLNSAAEAIGRLQLLHTNPAPTYRLEFDFSGVANNVRFAKGRQDSIGWLEILTKDYLNNPQYGQPGGGLQFLVDGIEINPTAIYELSTGNKVWPIP